MRWGRDPGEETRNDVGDRLDVDRPNPCRAPSSIPGPAGERLKKPEAPTAALAAIGASCPGSVPRIVTTTGAVTSRVRHSVDSCPSPGPARDGDWRSERPSQSPDGRRRCRHPRPRRHRRWDPKTPVPGRSRRHWPVPLGDWCLPPTRPYGLLRAVGAYVRRPSTLPVRTYYTDGAELSIPVHTCPEDVPRLLGSVPPGPRPAPVRPGPGASSARPGCPAWLPHRRASPRRSGPWRGRW